MLSIYLTGVAHQDKDLIISWGAGGQGGRVHDTEIRYFDTSEFRYFDTSEYFSMTGLYPALALR